MLRPALPLVLHPLCPSAPLSLVLLPSLSLMLSSLSLLLLSRSSCCSLLPASLSLSLLHPLCSAVAPSSPLRGACFVSVPMCPYLLLCSLCSFSSLPFACCSFVCCSPLSFSPLPSPALLFCRMSPLCLPPLCMLLLLHVSRSLACSAVAAALALLPMHFVFSLFRASLLCDSSPVLCSFYVVLCVVPPLVACCCMPPRLPSSLYVALLCRSSFSACAAVSPCPSASCSISFSACSLLATLFLSRVCFWCVPSLCLACSFVSISLCVLSMLSLLLTIASPQCLAPLSES
eukprot:SAG11_NODE_3575_length_2359_cov_3.684071_3_plen_289_part_00